MMFKTIKLLKSNDKMHILWIYSFDQNGRWVRIELIG